MADSWVDLAVGTGVYIEKEAPLTTVAQARFQLLLDVDYCWTLKSGPEGTYNINEKYPGMLNPWETSESEGKERKEKQPLDGNGPPTGQGL